MFGHASLSHAPPPPPQPLLGRQIVSLAVNVPGPVAAARLRELGATVVKVEPPEGDPLAAHAPAWYRSLTAGQEVRRLDLKTAADRAALDALLEAADLLLTAQRPGALARLGLDPARLQRRFPHLLHVAITGYPAPRQEEPGHDLTYLAEAGLVFPPALPPTLIADLAGAERAVSAALALLLARERGQTARYAEVSLAEAAAGWAAPLRHGLTAPGGVLGGGFPLYRCYPGRDGWVALAALEPRFVRRLLEELGFRPDPAGGTGSGAGPGAGPEGWKDFLLPQDVLALEDFLAGVFRQRPAREWEDWARERDLPLVAVRAGGREPGRSAGR